MQFSKGQNLGKSSSQGVIEQTSPLERSPCAPKYELKKRSRNKSDAPTETRGKMAEGILKLKEKDKARFFSSADVWCLPAPSSTKLEESEFVVDSEASMHMLSRKDLNPAELETFRVSRNPTTVIKSNWGSANKGGSNCARQRFWFVCGIH